MTQATNPTAAEGRTREDFPGIRKACLEIAYDNGGINRDRPWKKQQAEFDAWLVRQPSDLLPPIEAWLSSLSKDNLRIIAAGGQDEPETIEIMKDAPPFTDDLLNSYFAEIC